MQDEVLGFFNQFSISVEFSYLLAAELVLIVIAVIVVHVMSAWLLQRFYKPQAQVTPLTQARKTALWSFWWLASSGFLDVLNKVFPDIDLTWMTQYTIPVLMALLGWLGVRMVTVLTSAMVSPNRDRIAWDKTTADAIGKFLKIVIVIVITLMVMQELNFSISGVLAFSGVGGVAVGFAARDMLANFFGGLMIYLDRQFVVGDWIRSPDKEIEGTVEHIGWRITRIRTFDMRPLYVPNSTFTSISVENPSRMLHRRFYETFGLRYQDQDKVEKVTAAVKAMLMNHPAIATEQTLMVNLNTFNQHSIDFFVYCFTKTTKWAEFHVIKQALLSEIADIVEQHEAEFAYPTQSIFLSSYADGAKDEVPVTSHTAATSAIKND